MPTSQRRLEANRRNAQKSTGPKTIEGKQRSRANATTHGLTAAATIYKPLRGENPDHFVELRGKLIEDYQPATTAEHLAIEMAAAAYKRIQRAEAMEASFFDGAMATIQRDHGVPVKPTNNEPLGEAIVMGAAEHKLTWENLDRYRRNAWLDYNRSLEQIRRLQKERVDAELRALQLHEKQQQYLERTHVPTMRRERPNEPLGSFRRQHKQIAKRLTDPRRTPFLVPQATHPETGTHTPRRPSTNQDLDSPCNSSNS